MKTEPVLLMMFPYSAYPYVSRLIGDTVSFGNKQNAGRFTRKEAARLIRYFRKWGNYYRTRSINP